MNRTIVAALPTLCLLAPGCVLLHAFSPLAVVENVDVSRYMGTWYEIARYPNFFQQPDCAATTAEYTLLDDGRVRVVNRCREGGVDGPEDSIEGVARVVDPLTNAKLKVRFSGPFEGDYWIIDLDPDYSWAVVGEPSRSFLWILSRTPTMDEDVYDAITSRLPDKLYDPDRLLKTLQPSE
jgi:apolipoprotein D and lipocalin family protein